MIIDNISMALKLKQLEILRCLKVSVAELFGFRKKKFLFGYVALSTK